MSKTKELLEGLGNIVRKPSAFKEEKYDSYTNRFYITQHSFHKLPAKYDKAKRHKDEDDYEYVLTDSGGLIYQLKKDCKDDNKFEKRARDRYWGE